MDAELKEKLRRIAIAAALAAVSAAAVTAGSQLLNTDLGAWTPWAQAAAVVLLKVGQVATGL